MLVTVTGTPEEVILDLGMNIQPFAGDSPSIPITQRLIINYYTAKRMLAAGNTYLSAHPQRQLHASEVIRRGWVTNLPRLRDMLSRSLTATAQQRKA